MTDISGEKIPRFNLEDFMKSITYPPEGMTTNLARKIVTEEGKYLDNPDREVEILREALMLLPLGFGKRIRLPEIMALRLQKLLC